MKERAHIVQPGKKLILPDGTEIYHTHLRTHVAELIVDVSAQLQGEITDWPANIQDGVYAAMERLVIRTRKPYEIIRSHSDTDVDTGPYIHVVAVCREEVKH